MKPKHILMGLCAVGLVAFAASQAEAIPPDVYGVYDLTATDCVNPFVSPISVYQNGSSIDATGSSPQFLGTIQDDGSFTMDSADVSCAGNYDEFAGTATATCTLADLSSCSITYTLR